MNFIVMIALTIQNDYIKQSLNAHFNDFFYNFNQPFEMIAQQPVVWIDGMVDFSVLAVYHEGLDSIPG